MFFVISLICVVVFAACSNEDNEIITSSPEDVVFNNPIISVADNMVIVSVNVSSPRGEETLSKEFYIDNILDISLIYSDDVEKKPEITNIEKKLVNSEKENDGYFSYEMGEYLIMVTSELPKEDLVTGLRIILPRNISVKYNESIFVFDNIDFNCEVNDSFKYDGFNTSYYDVYFNITLGQDVLKFIGGNQIQKIRYY